MTDTNLGRVITVGVVLFYNIIPGVCVPITIVQLTKQLIKLEIDALTAMILQALDVTLAYVFQIF